MDDYMTFKKAEASLEVEASVFQNKEEDIIETRRGGYTKLSVPENSMKVK